MGIESGCRIPTVSRLDTMSENAREGVKYSARPSTDRPLSISAERRVLAANVFQGLFVAGLLVLLAFFQDHPSVQTLSITFISILLEAIPFVLIGSLIGGFIEVFVPREHIAAVLPRGKGRTLFLAAGLGLVFPVCECAIVPVVRRLIHKGLPLGAAVAFLLGGPIVNPLVAASTAVAYNFAWTVVLQRMILGYLVAVAVGLVFGLFFTESNAFLDGDGVGKPAPGDAQLAAEGRDSVSTVARISLAVEHAAGDFIDIGRFLVIGAFVAGMLQAFVPRGIFIALAETPALSVLAMMAMAVGLNLCSEADAFVAASFRMLLPLAAQMAFMVLGPMLDVKLLMMYLGLFRKRAIVFLAMATILMVFAAVMAAEMLR